MSNPEVPVEPAPQSLVIQRRFPALIRQLMAFGAVGVAGFVIDAGTLYLVLWLGLGLIPGRLVSYVMAATSTWGLNRRFTFTSRKPQDPWREWALFMVSQLAGAIFNLGLYAGLVTKSALIAAQPIIAVAAGSLAGMLVNFFVAKKFVFKER